MKSSQGFTLIELVVTVAIVAVLASVVVPMAQVTVQRSKEQELKLALREIRSALDAYKRASDEGRIYRSLDSSGYPESLAVLAEGSLDIKDPRGRKIYFLRRIPRDPLNPDERLKAEATWGKRSYRSEADNPQEGEDIYDIFSLSPRSGLNGQPYRDW